MSVLKTPDDLASTPEYLETAQSNFDYSTQKNTASSPLMSGMGTPTFNGTQTFDYNGRPSDSDQDNDRSD